MLRLVEVVLFLAPFGVVAVWRLLLPAQGPSLRVVIATGALTAVLAAGLLWFWAVNAEPPFAAYIPSHVDNGRIIPATEAPR